MRRNERSSWFEGVLHAEILGARISYDELFYKQLSDYDPEFVKGMLDYVTHYERVLLASTPQQHVRDVPNKQTGEQQ